MDPGAPPAAGQPKPLRTRHRPSPLSAAKPACADHVRGRTPAKHRPKPPSLRRPPTQCGSGPRHTPFGPLKTTKAEASLPFSGDASVKANTTFSLHRSRHGGRVLAPTWRADPTARVVTRRF